MVYFTSTLGKAKCEQSLSLPPQISMYYFISTVQLRLYYYPQKAYIMAPV
jgi:hypothetical protein